MLRKMVVQVAKAGISKVYDLGVLSEVESRRNSEKCYTFGVKIHGVSF